MSSRQTIDSWIKGALLVLLWAAIVLCGVITARLSSGGHL